MTHRLLTAAALFLAGFFLVQQPAAPSSEEAAVNLLYQQWSEAIAKQGAEGYASFFLEDGAVLPPNRPAVEGRTAIREWIASELAAFSTKNPRFVPVSLQVENGWAVRRFRIAGTRVQKQSGEASSFDNKYLDVLRKQSNGEWRFLYRMWSSNQP